MKKVVFIFVIAVVFLSSCKSTIDKNISNETFSKDVTVIKKKFANVYTSEDFDKLMAIGAGMMIVGDKFVVKTYRQLLDEAKQDRLKIEEEFAKLLADYEKKMADFEAVKKELSGAVSVKIVDRKIKSYAYSDDKAVYVTISYENIAGRKIKALEGLVTIYDVFGGKIDEYYFSDEDGIEQGIVKKYDVMDFVRSYETGKIPLIKSDIEKLKAEHELVTLVYDDGTTVKRLFEPEKPIKEKIFGN